MEQNDITYNLVDFDSKKIHSNTYKERPILAFFNLKESFFKYINLSFYLNNLLKIRKEIWHFLGV